VDKGEGKGEERKGETIEIISNERRRRGGGGEEDKKRRKKRRRRRKRRAHSCTYEGAQQSGGQRALEINGDDYR